ncbi:MAG: hypothetical protein Q9217_000111 [Psora testacea]
MAKGFALCGKTNGRPSTTTFAPFRLLAIEVVYSTANPCTTLATIPDKAVAYMRVTVTPEAPWDDLDFNMGHISRFDCLGILNSESI